LSLREIFREFKLVFVIGLLLGVGLILTAQSLSYTISGVLIFLISAAGLAFSMSWDVAFALLLGVGLVSTTFGLFLVLLSYVLRCVDTNPCAQVDYTPSLIPIFLGVFLILVSFLLRSRMRHEVQTTNYRQSVGGENSE
jgi:hypothetical protein